MIKKLQWTLCFAVLLCSGAYALEPDIIYVNGRPVYIEGIDLSGARAQKNEAAATATTASAAQLESARSNAESDIYRGHVLGDSTPERNTQYGEIYRGTVFGKDAATGFDGEVAHVKNISKTKLVYDTPLIHAIKIGDADRVRTLIYANVNPEERNYAGMTPLTIAAEKDNYEIVRLLVEEGGVDVNAVSSYGITPLIAAAAGGHREAVELLLKHNADATARDDLGKTALIHAMNTDNRRLTELLAKSNPAAINVPDNTGNTPLLYAAQKGNAENVRILLKYQANPDYQNPSTGASALIAATSKGHNKAATQLVSAANATLDLRDNTGRTALFYAVQNGLTTVARQLMRKGAFVNAVDAKGTNLLMVAAAADNTSIMSDLTPQYLPIESVDREGKTPLMYSTTAKNGTKALQWLINKGALLNAKDFNGNTALMHAIKNNNKPAATLLLKQDVDLSAVNKNQQTAFSLAQDIMPASQVNMLLKEKKSGTYLQTTAQQQYNTAATAAKQQYNAATTAAKQQYNTAATAAQKQMSDAKQQMLRYQAEQEVIKQDAELAALQKQLNEAKAKKEAQINAKMKELQEMQR